jgi:carbamoyl-phosphate synthase/aspartate carbamoyltransferase/dihydroorotase
MILRIPGMVDPHVHLRDLDWAHKATFASETAAALAGGYWAIIDMPNTPPPTINRANLDLKRAAMQRQAVCDWGLYFGASQDGNEAEYAGIFGDVCGLKIYNNATTGTLLIEDQSLREAHYAAWTSPKPIAVHAEEATVADILALVRKYRRFTHFCHISTTYEIDLLRAAKSKGLPISVGVCPHHLYLTQDDVATLGALGRMKPELKTTADRDALWAAIADGTVDVVESDHAPHTLAEKASEKPPSGVPGLETNLPLMLLAVEEGRLTHERLIELLATNAQRIWGLQPDAETYTLVDTAAHYTIDRSRLKSACGWSPFEGMRVPGRVVGVWIRGVQAYDGETVCVGAGFGSDLAAKQVMA